MSQSNINIEKKLYRHIVKGIGFYHNQLNKFPSLAEIKTFVQTSTQNLTPISRFDEKVEQAMGKLENLSVCYRMPEGVYALWTNHPALPVSKAPIHRQVRFNLTEAHSFGLVANLGVVGEMEMMESSSGLALNVTSEVANEAVLNEALDHVENNSAENVETVKEINKDSEPQPSSSVASIDEGVDEENFEGDQEEENTNEGENSQEALVETQEPDVEPVRPELEDPEFDTDFASGMIS